MAYQDVLRDKAFVGNGWIGAEDGRTFAVCDPSDGTRIAELPDLSAADAEKAIEAASEAFSSWRRLPAKERARHLHSWRDQIIANSEALAELLTREQGKPLAESRGEIGITLSFIEWFAEEAKRAYGDVIPTPGPDRRLIVTKEPVGVVAAITPWNFPSAMIARKAAPALAAGCPIVVKPAPDTPLSALALASLAEAAGLPKGVLNVVTASHERTPEVGEALVGSPVVRKLTFTGSTRVGKMLLKEGADTLKRVSLELGGNAPFIVFADADIDAAVEGAITAKYRNSGQACISVNRFFAEDAVYDTFVARLGERVSRLKVGPGLDAATEQGPLINGAAIAKVERLLSQAVSAGARVVVGGARHDLGATYFQPTVVADVTQDMELCHNEVFGPISPIIRFRRDDEAIAMANDTRYGLAAYFYANDLARVWRTAEALEAGMVSINTGMFATEAAPFGGMKESGIGREGSRYGLDEFLEIKYWCIGGLTA